MTNDDINLEGDQFGRENWEPLGLPLGRSVVDHEVATLDVTEATQFLTEGFWVMAISGRVVRLFERSWPSVAPRRRSAPRRASQRGQQERRRPLLDDLLRAPQHGGNVTPSALAVLRLIANSDRVGRWKTSTSSAP
jgi:hypothetical protein